MRYQSSAAAYEDYAERGQALEQSRRSFEVVTGGGLDERARRGVSRQFLARAKAVAAIVVALCALGGVRVALTSAAVSTMQANSVLKTQISDAQTENDQLLIQRSVLSSNARISRIATQNLGLVQSGASETITIGASAAAADAGDAVASSEQVANDAEVAEPSEGVVADASSDGDAAQYLPEVDGSQQLN